ncbi:MAG: hypothetical protein CMJ81_06940 [Planctomycetaceae bacterium]|nr:hypothetical protein [Planctomycetaceae bacterium]MBP62617.1 hypothetical protein [Planctomycetaceae bacterium]
MNRYRFIGRSNRSVFPGICRHVVRKDWPAANQVIPADLNGDHRPDIVAIVDDDFRRMQGALEMRWWKNPAPPEKVTWSRVRSLGGDLTRGTVGSYFYFSGVCCCSENLLKDHDS